MNQYVIAYDIADKKTCQDASLSATSCNSYPAKHLSVLRFGIAKDGLHIRSLAFIESKRRFSVLLPPPFAREKVAHWRKAVS